MWSTKTIYEYKPAETPINKTGDITNLAFADIEATGTSGKIYTDQTGCFPVTSRKGTKYVCVVYCYDTNAIITETLKENTGKVILRA